LIERFEAVTQATFAEAIGMTGYGFENKKGLLRYRLDLEDMGRVGLLLVARGRWGQTQVLPAWFVRAMETPQVGEDVEVHYHPHKHHARAAFPEAPYGYRCWVNARRDVFPDADAGWCWGNREGHFLLWNHELGIVFATDGIEGAYTSWREGPHERSIAWQIEQQIVGDNPLFAPAVESASD
jgi:CubicO group peptidase (beta-lactamase class C family)